MGRELSLALMPDGTLSLEQAPSEVQSAKSAELLEEEFERRFGQGPGFGLLFLGLSDPGIPLSPSMAFFRGFARLFVTKLLRTPDLEELRDKAVMSLEEEEVQETLASAPLFTGAEYLSKETLLALWEDTGAAFARSIQTFSGPVADFIRAHSPNAHLVGRVFFHLVENKNGEQPFAFLATYSSRVSGEGASRHLPLRQALVECRDDTEKLVGLLSAVYRAAEKSQFVRGLLDSGEVFHPLALSDRDAYTFLREAPLYEECGILCRIPNWWRPGRRYASATVTVGKNLPSRVGMEAILDTGITVTIGGAPLTIAEAGEILARHEGLALIKNRWVAVDPEKLKKVLSAVEKITKTLGGEGVSLHEAMRLELSAGRLLGGDAAEVLDVSVSAGEWLGSVMRRLQDPASIAPADPGPGFKGDLRAYQEQGVNWLHFLQGLGFGACLADDMGLGKTIQVLALLSALSQNGGDPSLLVVPASLVANWEDEIQKFAPGLRYRVAHPQLDRTGAPPVENEADSLSLVITTYSMVRRLEWLAKRPWNLVILDEAQAIKNPGSQQTRSVKKIQARTRLAMTGTPVENRLSDLWSLFDFINPGLLGTAREFNNTSKALAENPEGYARLRKVVRPYILRRLKTDKSVISDLPDKVEMLTWAGLEKTQTALYRAAVEGLARKLEEQDGIERKGLILSALMKLKQLCNHPSQYLGGGGYAEAESGKFARLREICETIREKRERVLVFTQFREITGPLSEFLTGIFGREGLVLHGGVPAGKRKDLVARFQDTAYTPYMLLSLKAGGVGLNLTRANHVIHFDRWWNPAVENQATDRAFRIGQKNSVLVHKFVTKGTIEEKIARMIEDKTRLSDALIAQADGTWITEMDNKSVLDMFRLTL
jgi:non-specific serine/threonine protein kinase